MLWGSDWPHPDPSRHPEEISPPLPIDDASVLALLAGWAGNADVYRKILRDNPARLYEFEQT
jgi:predicted TIM-barrel fold metal-dependent hydrolase